MAGAERAVVATVQDQERNAVAGLAVTGADARDVEYRKRDGHGGLHVGLGAIGLLSTIAGDRTRSGSGSTKVDGRAPRE